MRLLPLLALLLTLCCGVSVAVGETRANASLVRDLGLDGIRGVFPPNPRGLEAAGSRVFFYAGDAQVWTSDGTVPGTRAVAEPCDSAYCPAHGIVPLGVVGADFFFVVEGQPWYQLWASDGYEGGTRVVGGWLGSSSGEHSPRQWARRQHLMLWIEPAPDFNSQRVVAWNGEHRTVLLEGEGFFTLFELENRVLVERALPFGEPSERWETDGTVAGTRLLGTSSRRLDPDGVALGDLWIGSSFFTGPQVLSTSGSPASDLVLTTYIDPNPFQSNSFGFQRRGDHVYWPAWDVLTGWELWRSDGTVAGTGMVSAFAYAFAVEGIQPAQVAEHDGAVVFVANDGVSGCSVWRAAPPAPPQRIDDVCAPSVHLVGDDVLWPNDYETTEIRGLRRGSATPTSLAGCTSPCDLELDRTLTHSGRHLVPSPSRGIVEVDDLAIVRVEPLWPIGFPWLVHAGPHRFALVAEGPLGPPHWVQQPQLVRLGQNLQILGVLASLPRSVAGSFPENLTPTASRVWFSLCDESSYTRRFGTSDGTSAGTILLETPGYTPCFDFDLVPVGDRALTVRDSGELVVLSPTGVETLALEDPIEHALPELAGGFAIVVARSPEGGTRVLRTDGTVEGTALLADYSEAQIVAPILAAGNHILLTQHTPEGQAGLYSIRVADGHRTRHSTIPLSPVLAAVLQGKIHVVAEEPGGGPSALYRIEASGSLAHLGDTSHPSSWRWSGLFALDQSVVLVTELFAGVRLLFAGPDGAVELAPGVPAPTFPLHTSAAAQVGDRVVFAAASVEEGTELWSTDGTVAGTGLLADLRPGRWSSSPRLFTAAGDRVFFVANNGRHGAELWETNGTAEGTRMVQDIAPGPVSSVPLAMATTADRLFLTADDGSAGHELWSLPLAASTCVPGEYGLCLGARHRVEIEWRDFSGGIGRGTPVPLTADSGAFWFFRDGNIESIVKVLDGRPLNDHRWVFFGSLTNVDFALTVTDVDTGVARRWINPSGNFASAADTQAFGPLGAGLELSVAPGTVGSSGPIVVTESWNPLKAAVPCVPSSTRLCLAAGRFAVEATWRDFTGGTGVASTRPITADTGALWFFREDNLEVLIKVLDGRPLNGAFWVFFGAISNVEYELIVTDSTTGVERRYHNPSGNFASIGDTGAFPSGD